jgi:hypothetical protein
VVAEDVVDHHTRGIAPEHGGCSEIVVKRAVDDLHGCRGGDGAARVGVGTFHANATLPVVGENAVGETDGPATDEQAVCVVGEKSRAIEGD